MEIEHPRRRLGEIAVGPLAGPTPRARIVVPRSADDVVAYEASSEAALRNVEWRVQFRIDIDGDGRTDIERRHRKSVAFRATGRIKLTTVTSASAICGGVSDVAASEKVRVLSSTDL